MHWEQVTSLDDLRRVEAPLADALIGKSLDFFEPTSRGVHWEVERKPYTPQVLALLPSQHVSRAWDFVFRVVLSRIAPLGWAPPAYRLPSQAEPPATGPQYPQLELPDEDRPATKQAVEAINVATAVANAVVADAAERCRREHQQLAQELGLTRPPVGFPRN